MWITRMAMLRNRPFGIDPSNLITVVDIFIIGGVSMLQLSIGIRSLMYEERGRDSFSSTLLRC